MRERMSGNRQIRFIGFTLFFIFSLTAGLYSCGEITGSKKNNPNAPTAQPGKLYISNLGDGSLIAFDNASTAEGNIPPSRRFPESITGPTGIFLDQASDTLYVANTDHNAILIYEQASTLNPPVGLASATRVISGTKTGLNHPYAVVYDAGRGLLYVANKENSVSVFSAGCAGVASLGGNIAPCRTLSGSSTLLDFPRGLALDAGRDILYISNMGSDSILVYADASQSTTQGNLAPTREIRGHSGPEIESILELPFGLAIDSANDRLYVVNIGRNRPAILIFESASSRSGESIPERLINGLSTQLSQPAGIHLDAAGDRLYVVNSNNTNNGPTAVVVFGNISTQCAAGICNLSPSQSVTGQNTGLTNPSGIAFNPKKGIIYIGNTGGNNILLFSLDGNISPLKLNSGNFTILESPSGFYYDQPLDRLYIINFTAASNSSFPGTTPHITVYDNVSSRNFANTKPDWIILGSKVIDGTSVQQEIFDPRGIYIDKKRGYLLVLSTNQRRRLLIYDLNHAKISAKSQTLLPETPLLLPCLDPDLSKCTTPPPGGGILSDGLSVFPAEGPVAMTVDEERGDVYIADPGNNSIIVYDLDLFTAPSSPILKTRTIRGLNRPFGLYIDTVRDILYVANAGASGANANTIFAFSNASTKSDLNLPETVSPDRIISSSANFAAEEKLDFPTSLFVDTFTDRLFVVNQSKDSIFIFDDASARPTGATRPDRKLSGSNTLFAFSQGNTSALWVDSKGGKESLFVGQPKDPTCGPGTCPRGALLLFGVQGNVPPSKTWSGGEAPLAGPSALAVDTARDILYTANQGDPAATADDSLFSFSDVSLIQGSLQDHREVCSPDVPAPSSACPETKLNNPAGLFIDSERNRLYVSNSGTTNCKMIGEINATLCNAILVYHGASSLVANSFPDQIFFGDAINNPHGLTLDTTMKTLYVANTGGHSVLIFKNVEGMTSTSTPVTPDAEIGGIQSRVNAPVGVAIDSERDILYVLNQGAPEILVFEGASTRNGNTPPDRIISGSGFMVTSSALFLDPAKDLLYMADQGANAIYIFNSASSAQGQAEHKTLSGNNTGLNLPSALFVDTTR